MEKIEFTREELYELVWSEPLSRLARKYDISDTGIRKKCKKMNIPLPKNGYWSKIKYGYKVPKSKLSSKYEGDQKTILSYRDKDGKYVEKFESISPITKLKHELKKDKNLPLAVPDRITQLDSLVVKAKRSLLKKDTKTDHYVGMRTTEQGEINIMVSELNIDRALRFMNTLIKLLRSRKHDVIIEDKKTFAVVFGEKLQIRFREKAKIVNQMTEYGFTTREYHPSGTLTFMHDKYSYNQKAWIDGKIPLESRLAEILAYFEIYAQNEIAERIEREKRNKIEAEERERQKELQQRKDNEIKKIKELINRANYWKQAQILREYISAFERNEKLDQEQMNWIQWAQQKTEWFDTLTLGPDEILNDKDRQKLMEELNKKETKTNFYW